MLMRSFNKLLAAAAVVALLAPASAFASSISIAQQGTGLTNIVLPAAGPITIDVTLNADADGVSSLAFNLIGAPAASFTAFAIGPMTPLTPGSAGAGGVTGQDWGCFLAICATSQSGVVMSATFNIPQSGATIHIDPDFINSFFAFDNAGNDVAPTLLPNSVTVTVVPEPGTLMLLGSGLTGLLVFGRRKA